MSNIIYFQPGRITRKKRIQKAAEDLVNDWAAPGHALLAFKRKFLDDPALDCEERFTIGVHLLHESICQIIQSQAESGFTDEDIRCLVAMVVDGLISEGEDIQ